MATEWIIEHSTVIMNEAMVIELRVLQAEIRNNFNIVPIITRIKVNESTPLHNYGKNFIESSLIEMFAKRFRRNVSVFHFDLFTCL